MDIAFSTLGCPGWGLEAVTASGAENGYNGVDLRGYDGELDVTRHPLFETQPDRVRSTLGDAGLTVCCLSSGIELCEADRRAENVAEARRLVSLARKLDVGKVRVFGSGDTGSYSMDELAHVAGETMQAILGIDGARDVRWLLETHDNWTASADSTRLLEELPTGNVGLVWDAAHTMRLAGETPVETLDAMGDAVEHVHLKDAVYDPDDPASTEKGWRYVLPGAGDVAIDDAVRELRARGYDGWLVFEHEKRWHPGIADPEDAFPAFAKWYRSLDGGT